MIAALVVAALGSLAPYAVGHIGPSVRENNRYLKLTLLGARARLLYTFYVGEVPGAQARRRMDANGDGRLDAAETQAYGDELANTVAANLEVTVDGANVPLVWDDVVTGIGTPTVNAGAFSIDMIAWLCLDGARASHAVVLYDRWVPPTPGETELRIEESPGVVARSAKLGDDAPVSQLRARWVGATPLRDLGLHLTFDVDAAEADMTPGDTCGEARAADENAAGRGWVGIAGAVAAIVFATAVVVWRKRRA